MAAEIPPAWLKNSWEEKARQNPLFAVQTTDDMAGAPAQGFTPAQIEQLFDRGRRLYRERLTPLLAGLAEPRDQALIVEYGCGVGRILRSLVDAGYRCAGIDISPTMLDHCRRLVPEVEGVWCLDEAGRSALEDETASVVFSYAVLQHISTFTAYTRAIDEICRVLKPGGLMAIHLNCEDFCEDPPTRTVNYEARSVHYRNGEDEPYLSHKQQQWSGVYIGYDALTDRLSGNGVTVERWFFHNPLKLRGIWVVGRKG